MCAGAISRRQRTRRIVDDEDDDDDEGGAVASTPRTPTPAHRPSDLDRDDARSVARCARGRIVRQVMCVEMGVGVGLCESVRLYARKCVCVGVC